MNIPVTFFVLRHGDDWVAFDTGDNAMCAKDPVGYWGEQVTAAYYPVMADYEEFKIQLKKLGLTPAEAQSSDSQSWTPGSCRSHRQLQGYGRSYLYAGERT